MDPNIPADPAVDNTDRSVSASNPNRRDFLKWGFLGSMVLVLGGCGQAVLTFLYPKKPTSLNRKVIVPGTIADYPLDSVTLVREGKFYLSHVPDGLLALYWKCKHLGCTVPWKPNEEFDGKLGVFHCPCHESIYLRTGQNVAGPAPDPLDIMPIELSGNTIVVDTGKITSRTLYKPEQATKVP